MKKKPPCFNLRLEKWWFTTSSWRGMIRSVLAFNFRDVIYLWSQVCIYSWQWAWQLCDYTKRDHITIFRTETQGLPMNVFLYCRRHDFQAKKVRYLLLSMYRSYFRFHVWLINHKTGSTAGWEVILLVPLDNKPHLSSTKNYVTPHEAAYWCHHPTWTPRFSASS